MSDEFLRDLQALECSPYHNDDMGDLVFARLQVTPVPPSDACYSQQQEDMARAMLMIPRKTEAEARAEGYNSAEEAWLGSCEQAGFDVWSWMEPPDDQK